MADPGWMQAWAELADVHREKSATYGDEDDALANFTAISDGLPDEAYVVGRMREKLVRAANMIRSGDGDAVKEYMDVASLALCAEALRRRRL